MDRQDAKPRRPSLLAGAPEHATATPSSARILADMSGDKPATRDATQLPRRRWVWLSVAATLMIAAAWFWQGDFLRGDTGAYRDLAREPAIQSSPQTAGDASSTGPDRQLAATIIDDATDLSSDGSGTTAGRTTAATDDDGASLVDDPSPFAAMMATTSKARPDATAGAGNPFTAAPPSRPAASRNRSPSRSLATRSAGDQTDLLATLLRNIQAHAESQPSGLDSLIQKMETSETADTPPRTVLAKAAPTRSQQIQANLRECPAANTAKGLKCRQDICAVYAGRDPACPAM